MGLLDLGAMVMEHLDLPGINLILEDPNGTNLILAVLNGNNLIPEGPDGTKMDKIHLKMAEVDHGKQPYYYR